METKHSLKYRWQALCERARPAVAIAAAFIADKLRASPLAVVFVLAFVGTLLMNPAKLGLLVWGIAKVSAGGYLGYWCDRLLFRSEDRPHLQQGIARGTAWKRRALIAAAAIFAMGMIQ